MEKKYFQHWAESVLGEGIILLEATGDEITRQVEIYGDSVIWCDSSGQSDDRFMLADQPVSAIGLDTEHEIPASDFEAAWRKARVVNQ
ncbi:TPA: hypothetical protein QDZ34_000123 [Stenotrophomonas maltophilia]|nr:hypothetical protein [Stenotrophomonas maltophilia]HDS1024059.1 hypothetical protein [Stenotrophomonas maltophilia]HDS1028446.1 hypothetical protein [Stenotrophomonas maltophilia]HDS1032822.1 hypothetical protein [Stenotrophomonas maltophilia]